MAILSRDEFFARIHDKIGSDSSDDSISFLEDMSDTYNDLENKANNDNVDWEKKYHELDESWKKRYTHRFFSGDSRNIPGNDDDGKPDYDAESVSFESIFTESEDK